MARINKFTRDSGASAREHPAEVDFGYAIVSLNGKRYFQLNTFGSASRKIPGKVSQTLQLDERSGKALMAILEEAFS